jgi:hypothetical protein
LNSRASAWTSPRMAPFPPPRGAGHPEKTKPKKFVNRYQRVSCSPCARSVRSEADTARSHPQSSSTSSNTTIRHVELVAVLFARLDQQLELFVLQFTYGNCRDVRH